MAITRCPYCHAIIDEADKYCNNCGTQLLFPEDDEADEEIPGEKIIDAEVEEKDYTVDEPEGVKRPGPAADDDEDIDERLEVEMKDRAAETALDELVAEGALGEDSEDVTEEVILVDEIEAAGTAEAAGTGELREKTGTLATAGDEDKAGLEEEREDGEDLEEDEAEDEEEEPDEDEDEKEEDDEEEDEDEGPDEKDIEKKEDTDELEVGEEAVEEEVRAGPAEKGPAGEGTAAYEKPREEPVAAAAEEVEIEYVTGPEAAEVAGVTDAEAPKSVTFDTRELEGLGRTVELGKERIDAYIEGLSGKKPAVAPAPPASVPASVPAPSPGGREPTGALPPWASGMKGAPVFPPDTAPVGPKKALGEMAATPTPAMDEEIEIFPKKRGSDSTMGLPERVAQAPLPFSRPGPAEEAEEEEPGEGQADATPPPDGPEARPERPAVRPPGEPTGPRRIEPLEDYEEAEPRGPFSFSVFLKSKAFDALFVGLFWLVALWLAAHATDRTLFEVLGSVSGPMLLLYAAFVLLYFFLFKFFLGETLGDRLFRPRE